MFDTNLVNFSYPSDNPGQGHHEGIKRLLEARLGGFSTSQSHLLLISAIKLQGRCVHQFSSHWIACTAFPKRLFVRSFVRSFLFLFFCVLNHAFFCPSPSVFLKCDSCVKFESQTPWVSSNCWSWIRPSETRLVSTCNSCTLALKDLQKCICGDIPIVWGLSAL